MANWYERHIVPHIIRLGCGCQLLAEKREPIIRQARGRVLELGIGAGANLPLYQTGNVTQLIGIEPSDELRSMASATPAAMRLGARLLDACGEDLPFADASFDTVVCTFTLCTVADERRTLAEARRVLRPGGIFLFCEHGRADDPGVARWQDRLDPAWKRVFGGCHLSRPVSGTISDYFTMASCERGYQEKMPRFAGWMERGCAVAA